MPWSRSAIRRRRRLGFRPFREAVGFPATLGEVKYRADVVGILGDRPIVTHPRHWERYSVEPVGRFVPEGRAGRKVVVIDQNRTASAGRPTSPRAGRS